MTLFPNYHIAIDGHGLDGHAKDYYEQKTADLIFRIARRTTGLTILNGIRDAPSGDWALIRPQVDHPKSCYSATQPSFTPISPTWNAWGIISFSPDDFTGACTLAPGCQADEMLLHELVHAHRMIARAYDWIGMSGSLRRFDEEDEVYAVTVVNVYISEGGLLNQISALIPLMTRLRADHRDTPLAVWELDSTLMRNPDLYRLVKKYCDQLPHQGLALSKVNATFNPFRVYYDWKARNYSP